MTTRAINVTALRQQLKKQRNFLRWMARRYEDVDISHSAAFTTGAEILEEIRRQLADGVFDGRREELFTGDRRRAGGSRGAAR